MLYPFMTLNDNTEIVHSECYEQDGKEVVRVEIEHPISEGFESATCYLPTYQWVNVHGFSQEDIDRLETLIRSLAHVIFDLARNGGFENAANL